MLLMTGPRTLVLLGLLCGCGADRPEATRDSDGAQTETGDATSDESGSTGDDPGADCEVAPGRVGLQRLTRAEYNRTVRDLFGVQSAPADDFPPDSTTSSFDNNAASLTASPQLVELLLAAAESVADEAMANTRGAIVQCDPGAPDCARESIAGLALRVYRRPATAAELDDLLARFEFARTEGEDFDGAIEHALVAMLVSPQFLYRNVPSGSAGPLQPGEIVALDDYEVATRLSYFLWGSTPDDELLARAGEGMLRDREVLRAEFDRMLADPKAAALYDGFVAQWLQLGKLGSATPAPTAFPQWSEQLRAEMIEETRLFFGDLLQRDGSALELVTGQQTFANEAIAALYGVEGTTGAWFGPIATDPTQRAGVLTMPAILTMTAGPEQPNIVKRGVWLAESILCAAPPPPAEGVPAEPVPQPGETERERLERHRTDPSCASCHNLIDPLGFAFEHYDALGRWRDEADGEPVDDRGNLPDGTEFTGVAEMAELLASGDDYPECVTQKLMTYALGRTTNGDDECVVSAIAEARVTADATLSDLLWTIVTSDAFLTEATLEDP
jgi:hypothetical protein